MHNKFTIADPGVRRERDQHMKNQGKSSNSGNNSKNSKGSSKGYQAKSNHDDRGHGNDDKDCRNDQSWDDKGKGGNNGKDKDHHWSDDHDNGDNGHGYGHQHSNGKGHDNHKGWGWGHHKHGCGDHDGDSGGDTGGGDTGGGTPLAALDDSAAGLASAIIAGNVLDNDTGSSLTATLISDVARGTLVLQDDGSFTFEPGEDFVALAEGETSVETFTYSITDADGGVAEASVAITVTGVNDAPEAQDASYVYPQGEFDVPHYIDLGGLVSDPDGDALSISLVDANGNHVNTLTLGNGEDDYAVVTLVGNQLEVVTSFFMVSGESIDIDYVVTDVHGESDLGLIGVQVLHGAPPVT